MSRPIRRKADTGEAGHPDAIASEIEGPDVNTWDSSEDDYGVPYSSPREYVILRLGDD